MSTRNEKRQPVAVVGEAMGKPHAPAVLIAEFGDAIAGEAERALANYLEVDLGASVSVQMERVQHDARQSMESALRMGLRLMAVRAQCEHGEFERLVREAGVGERDSQSCMKLASAIASEGDERRRAALLSMGKTKAVLLLSAKPEVRDQILGSADLLADALEGSTRELEALKQKLSGVETQRDTVIAEREGLAKQLRKRRRDEEENEGVPTVIADLRSEALALIKKGELAVASVYPLGMELAGLGGHAEAGVWVEPSARLVLSGLVALRLQLDGHIGSFVTLLGDDCQRLKGQPSSLAFLDDSEIKTVAEDWTRLTAMHKYEADLRAHEREKTKPKGKGRPANAPELPREAK